MKIACSIVTFNPDIDRLKENIDAIKSQVDAIIIVDNASENLDDILALVSEYDGVLVIQNDKNLGIAAGLNIAFASAEGDGFEYLLTLDQDSVVYPNIIEEYKELISNDIGRAVSFTCLRAERNFTVNAKKKDSEYEEIDICITAANLVKISAWRGVGGFSEELFIDRVDYDFCYKLGEAGYKIIRRNMVLLLQDIGNAYTSNFFGRKVTVLNHDAFRKYYIIRNSVYLIRRHPQSKKNASWGAIFRKFVVTLLFEKQKFKKIRAEFKGLRDGFKIKI